MITHIKVIHGTYNHDLSKSTSFWPTQPEWWDASKSIAPYALKSDVLPVGLTLDFPSEVPLYVLVGPNQVGKSTFIKALARSINNYNYFQENNRTALFNGCVGLAASASTSSRTGGAISARFGTVHSVKTAVLAVCNLTYRTSQHGSHENAMAADKFKEAYRFYIPHDEVFDTKNFAPYQRMSPQQVHARLEDLFTQGILDASSHNLRKQELIPKEVLSDLGQIAATKKLPAADVERRLVYLIDNCENVPQIPDDVNVFGQYAVHFAPKSAPPVVGIFDPNLKPKNSQESNWGYAQSEFAKIMAGHQNIVLLDEPTSNADRESRKWFRSQFLPAMVARKAFVILSTHEEWLEDSVAGLGGKIIDMYRTPTAVTSKQNE